MASQWHRSGKCLWESARTRLRYGPRDFSGNRLETSLPQILLADSRPLAGSLQRDKRSLVYRPLSNLAGFLHSLCKSMSIREHGIEGVNMRQCIDKSVTTPFPLSPTPQAPNRANTVTCRTTYHITYNPAYSQATSAMPLLLLLVQLVISAYRYGAWKQHSSNT